MTTNDQHIKLLENYLKSSNSTLKIIYLQSTSTIYPHLFKSTRGMILCIIQLMIFRNFTQAT